MLIWDHKINSSVENVFYVYMYLIFGFIDVITFSRASSCLHCVWSGCQVVTTTMATSVLIEDTSSPSNADGGADESEEDFKDYFSEINDIQSGKPADAGDEEDLCKTPDGQ